jgi:hypothetical protein
VCSGKTAFSSAFYNLSRFRVRESVGRCGTFDDFLATPAGRRQRREELAFIEAETQRLAPAQPGSIPCAC